MAQRITTVRAGAPAKGNVNPIPGRVAAGVVEGGYRAQLDQRSKRIPKTNGPKSAETDNPNGQSFGSKVQ